MAGRHPSPDARPAVMRFFPGACPGDQFLRPSPSRIFTVPSTVPSQATSSGDDQRNASFSLLRTGSASSQSNLNG